MAQRATNMKLTDMPRDEIEAKIAEVVFRHSVSITKFTKHKLSPEAIRRVEDLNTNRGKGGLFSWDHIKDGYTGGFFKYEQGKTPVMKSDKVKDFLAMVYCLILEEDA